MQGTNKTTTATVASNPLTPIPSSAQATRNDNSVATSSPTLNGDGVGGGEIVELDLGLDGDTPGDPLIILSLKLGLRSAVNAIRRVVRKYGAVELRIVFPVDCTTPGETKPIFAIAKFPATFQDKTPFSVTYTMLQDIARSSPRLVLKKDILVYSIPEGVCAVACPILAVSSSNSIPHRVGTGVKRPFLDALDSVTE